ncbi:MAG TPA: hypothetical protein VK631_13875 [Solirubrobacteraceae bacterium]|nr:hypothetical protein [Solirubrobacteraceae bacterium]
MSSVIAIADEVAGFAACDATLARLQEHIDEALARERDWEAGLDAALRLLLAFPDEQPGIARTWFVEMYASGPEAAGRHRCAVDRLALTLTPRRSPLDPTLQELIVAGGIWALLQRHVFEGSAARLPRLATDLRRHVVTLLGTE